MIQENHATSLWKRCLSFIKDNVNPTAYKTWFEPIQAISYDGKALTIGVPSPFFYEYLEEKYVTLLRTAIYKAIGEGTELLYSILTDKTNQISVQIEPAQHPEAVSQADQTPELDTHLNPNYIFENFVTGGSNEFSRAVAETIAKNPARTFNPFFLYGPSGVGKTHLVNAIGTRIKELYPQKRVLYVSAHLFQVQYTDSVRTNHFNDFISFYQTIDVLILDDVQELAGLTKTQNTFFHIFNHLHQSGKQLIMTSDRAPFVLQGFEDRLLSRFKWGLVAELQRPDNELRKNILRTKMKREGLVIPESVITYIADNVAESVRELEGILNSLLAQSILFKREIDLDMARRIVDKATSRTEDKKLTISQIVDTVCRHYGLQPTLIFSKTRKREIVLARQVAMFLAKEHTDSSLSQIGKSIGNKDHATVLHACRTVKGQMDIDKSFRAEINEIVSTL